MVLETKEYCALSFNGTEGDCERVFCFVLLLGLVEKIRWSYCVQNSGNVKVLEES